MSTESPVSSMCMLNNADRQERPLLNPCCVPFRQTFLAINEETCFLIILSSTLLITEVSEIGR